MHPARNHRSINQFSRNTPGDSTLEFTSYEKAEQFQKEVIALVQNKAEARLIRLREWIENQITATRHKLSDYIETTTLPIIDKARKRLNQDFSLNLSLPDLKFTEYQVPDVKASPTERFQKAKTKKERVWWTLWIWEREIEIEPSRSYYQVNLDKLIQQINNWLDKNMDEINVGVSNYIEKDFETQINLFLDKLNGYLKNYRDSLEKGLNDQKKSDEERECLTQLLTSIHTDLSTLLSVDSPNSIPSYRTKVELLMRGDTK